MLTPSTVSDEVRAFIASNFLYDQKRPFTNDDSFMQESILDSTGVVQLVSFLEETYNITASDEELIPDNLDSITKVTTYVMRKVRETAPSTVSLTSS